MLEGQSVIKTSEAVWKVPVLLVLFGSLDLSE